MKSQTQALADRIFPATERRYTFNLLPFIISRKAVNLTAEEFAAKIGWSTTYQYKLEANVFDTISEKTLGEIMQLFSRYTVIEKSGANVPAYFFTHSSKNRESLIRSLNNIVSCVIESFVVNPKALRTQRERIFTTKEFSIRAGWSTQYQYKLELGKVKHVSRDVREMIINLLTKGKNEND